VQGARFTLVAVLTLALGIGGTTTIFSGVDALFLRSLPYPDQNRLVALSTSYAKFRALKDQSRLRTLPKVAGSMRALL
jgi:putative ABC transport system permease protein